MGLQTKKSSYLGIALGVLVPLAVLGANLTTPFTFTPGTPIKASEMNANFSAVQSAVNSRLDGSGWGRLYEAELAPLAPTVTVGSNALDTTASGGMARKGLFGDSTGRLYGFTSTQLNEPIAASAVGVELRMKVLTRTSTTQIGTLSCTATRAGATTSTTLGTRPIWPTDFVTAATWQIFQVDCDFRPDDVNQQVNLDFVGGITDLSIDNARVSPNPRGSNLSKVSAVSGSRLKVLAIVGNDGSRSPHTPGVFYDSQLGMQCSAKLAVDGAMRCLPEFSGTLYPGFGYYKDGSCTTPLVLVYGGGTPTCFLGANLPPETLFASKAGQDPSGCVNSRIYSVGQPYTGTAVFEKGTGGCGVSTTTGPFYDLGPEVPASSFAALTLQAL